MVKDGHDTLETAIQDLLSRLDRRPTVDSLERRANARARRLKTRTVSRGSVANWVNPESKYWKETDHVPDWSRLWLVIAELLLLSGETEESIEAARPIWKKRWDARNQRKQAASKARAEGELQATHMFRSGSLSDRRRTQRITLVKVMSAAIIASVLLISGIAVALTPRTTGTDGTSASVSAKMSRPSRRGIVKTCGSACHAA